MLELYRHSQKLESVFELLGQEENHITASIGWVLANSPAFLDELMRHIFPGLKNLEINSVNLQESSPKGGYTDIELFGPNTRVIIEAKRGWVLPGKKQLQKYAKRLKEPNRKLVVMSECSDDYARVHLVKQVKGIDVIHLSWKEISELTYPDFASHKEKHLLADLRKYLGRMVKMQNQESNMVYVVALSREIIEGGKLSWIEHVQKYNVYTYPVSPGWPKSPPNYVGFRYGGKLQSIHHVESWEIVDDLSDWPEFGPEWDQPHFILKLGKAIIPPHDVKLGKLWTNARYWVMLDLLLTCKTLSDARKKTQKRQEEDY